MSRILLSKSEVLTTKAKAIFGDIVKEAMYAALTTSENYDYVYQKSFSQAEKTEEQFPVEQSISFDSDDVVVVFTNGRCVNFTASEWGTMTTISETEFESEKEHVVYLDKN